MKAILKLGFLAVIFLASCGKQDTSISELIAAGDLEAIREKKKELAQEQKLLETDIALLDSAIGAKVENKNLPLVTTFEVKMQQFDHFVELQGDVTTDQNVFVYPEAPGILLQVHVKEGQRVSKGQLLATVDDGGLKNQLLQLETQLSLAKTTFERQKRLWDRQIGTEIQYLQAKTNYEAQEKAVAQMNDQLAKFSVLAPFSGIIDDVIKEPGEVLAAGQGSELFRIVNLSDMYLEVNVPESYIANVKPGKKVKVYFPILGETIESRVRQTGNFINPDNRSFTAQIPVPNTSGNIKPNLTAKVQINDYTNDQAILIPQSVISENAEGEQYAFLASNIQQDSTAEAYRHIITTGKTQGDYVEVLTGIADGQSIILEGARTIKDGQQIKILEL